MEIVGFYTSAFFMDALLETIQTIKEKVELHVFIEISENSKKATIINIPSLKNLKFIENPQTVLGDEEWKKFSPYFEKVKSVQFVIFKNKKSFSTRSLIQSYKLGKLFKKMNIQTMHLDNISQRSIGLYLSNRKLRYHVSIHDPVAHIGEENIKDDFVNRLFLKKAHSVILYSAYSADLFKKNYRYVGAPVYVIPLQSYTFLKNYLKHEHKRKHILFYGRLSYYKGIDILLEAIPLILREFPSEKFIIAGVKQYNIELNYEIIHQFQENIRLIPNYLNTEEITELIETSKFVVCPYREATQSGVLMSTFSVGRSVVATDVGAFNEYVDHNKNGLLTKPDPYSLAETIIKALKNDYYLELEKKVISQSDTKLKNEIGAELMRAYNIPL